MPITSIWLDSRLKDFFIESKNAQIGVRTRKIWSSELKVYQEPHYCANPRNSVPVGCRSILATLVNAIFNPNSLKKQPFKPATNPSHAINMAQYGFKISPKQ